MGETEKGNGDIVIFVDGHYFGSQVLRQQLGKAHNHHDLDSLKRSTPVNDGARRQLLIRIDQLAGVLGSIKGRFFFTGCPVDVGADIAEREFEYRRCCHPGQWRSKMVTRLSELNDIRYFLFLGSRGHSQYYTSQDDICNAIESRLKTGTTFIYLTESKVLTKEIDECDSAVIDILWLVKRYRGRVYRLDMCSFLSDDIVLYT